MTTGDAIRVTTVVAVPPAAAFRAFTQDIGVWWRRDARHGLQPSAGGVLRFETGAGARLVEVRDANEIFVIGRVTAWEPGARLAFEWRTGGEPTLVEVRFEPHPRGTRVTLEHRGWDRVPAAHPARLGLDETAFPTIVGRFWADRLLAVRIHAEAGGAPASGNA